MAGLDDGNFLVCIDSLVESSVKEPQIRAALTQSLVTSVHRLPPEQQKGVLEGYSDEKVAKVMSAMRLGWFPLSAHVEILDRVKGVIGAGAFRQFHANLTVLYLEHPFMKATFDSAVRLFGLVPFALIGWIPNGWRLAFRDAGSVEFKKERPTEGWMLLRGMPASVAQSGSMFEALAGTAEVAFTLTKSTGSVFVTEADGERGDATYHVVIAG